MARLKDIKNQWGVPGGLNPQRADLWQVDLTDVITGINDIPGINPFLAVLPRYFTAMVALPEQKIRAEPVRRDSRAYNMPSWDEPLDAVRFNFIVDDAGGPITSSSEVPRSKIYTTLDAWRRVVRAGRGAVGAEEQINLDSNYRIDYRFPIYVYLARGVSMALPNFATTSNSANDPVSQQQSVNNAVAGDMEVSGVIKLENCWLSSFKIADLAYDKSGSLMLEASIYTENILQVSTQAD